MIILLLLSFCLFVIATRSERARPRSWRDGVRTVTRHVSLQDGAAEAAPYRASRMAYRRAGPFLSVRFPTLNWTALALSRKTSPRFYIYPFSLRELAAQPGQIYLHLKSATPAKTLYFTK